MSVRTRIYLYSAVNRRSGAGSGDGACGLYIGVRTICGTPLYATAATDEYVPTTVAATAGGDTAGP